MPALDKHDTPLPTTTVKWRFPSVHPGRPQIRCDRRRRRPRSSILVALSHFLGWLLVGADDLGRGLLPRSGAHHAARRQADRRAGRRPDHDDRQGPAAARAARAGRARRRRLYPRLDFHERVRRPHQSRADRRAGCKRIAYVPGKFLNADLDKASEDNERQHFLVEGADGVQDRLHPDRRAGRAADPALRQAKATWSRPASASA